MISECCVASLYSYYLIEARCPIWACDALTNSMSQTSTKRALVEKTTSVKMLEFCEQDNVNKGEGPTEGGNALLQGPNSLS